MKNKQAQEMRSEIESLLANAQITSQERGYLVTAQQQLQKGEYFPKIINQLETSFTPLAVKQQLSMDLHDFYQKLVRSHNKEGGRGLISVWGNPFV